MSGIKTKSSQSSCSSGGSKVSYPSVTNFEEHNGDSGILLKEIRDINLAILQRLDEPLAVQNQTAIGNQDSVDIRELCSVSPDPEEQVLLEYQAPSSGTVVIKEYGVFTDGLLASEFEFIPKVDGIRVLTQHGSPDENGIMRITLGLGSNLNDTSMIGCSIVLQAGQKLTWTVKNLSGSSRPMGVRIKGVRDINGRLVGVQGRG